jgi:hypothetical protein
MGMNEKATGRPVRNLGHTEKTMVRFTPPVRRELDAIAHEQRRSLSSLIDVIVTDWLIRRVGAEERP